MRQPISDPDVVMQRLERIEADSARFTQLLQLLDATAKRFKTFEQQYQRIEQDYKGIQNSFEQIKRVIETAVQRSIDQANHVDRLKNELEKWQQATEQSINRQSNDLREMQRKVSDSLRQVAHTLDEFERSTEERAERALQGIHNELEMWEKEFEQEQFNKLDHVIQTYNLIEMRVKNYETRIEALSSELKQIGEQVSSGLTEVEEAIENVKQEFEKAIRDNDTHWQSRLEVTQREWAEKFETTRSTHDSKFAQLNGLIRLLIILVAVFGCVTGYALLMLLAGK